MKRSFFQQVASFFAFLCIVFIPFPFNLIKFQSVVTDVCFGRLIGFVAKNIFGQTLTSTRVYSDSSSMYILVLLLFIIALLISLVSRLVKRWPLYSPPILGVIYRLSICYLALQLLKYGIDKIFKNQFYLPEPNTLYTPIGNVSRGLLFWTSMGTSHFYNIFLGSLEAIAAIFILIRRTRLLGLLMSGGILMNIIAINFGFDISVKLFSLFLLYLTLYGLAPYITRLLPLLLLHKSPGATVSSVSVLVPAKTFVGTFLKWLVTGLIFLEVFYPFIQAGNFNGDITGKPYLHGAYEVKQVITGTDTLSAKDFPVKRFFIHRNGYLIFQDQEDGMQDYKLTYNTDGSTFILTDYQLHKMILTYSYQPLDSVLVLQYFKAGKEYRLNGKAINWEKLPAVQKGFHWTVNNR
ncbi:MAG: hypothetical protein ABI688_07370 [Bacteroidota bacterium]